MMNNDGTCLFCDQKASFQPIQQSGKHVFHYECNLCGKYNINEDAYDY